MAQPAELGSGLQDPTPGGTPIEGRRALNSGVSVAEGLKAVEPKPEVAPRANAAEPIGPPVAEATVGATPQAPEGSEDGPVPALLPLRRPQAPLP